MRPSNVHAVVEYPHLYLLCCYYPLSTLLHPTNADNPGLLCSLHSLKEGTAKLTVQGRGVEAIVQCCSGDVGHEGLLNNIDKC